MPRFNTIPHGFLIWAALAQPALTQDLAAQALEREPIEAAYSLPSPSLAALDMSRNVGQLVLDAESGLFQDCVLRTSRQVVSVQDGYHTLATLLRQAREELPLDAKQSKAPQIHLQAIAEILREHGFQYFDYGVAGTTLLAHHTLSFGLARREIDCGMYVVLYLAIAEELGLPLRAISMPEHVALRWTKPDGAHINWEPTLPKELTDAAYIGWKSPHSLAIKKGVYMRPLSKREMLATAFYEKGLILLERKQLKSAQDSAQCATLLAPLYPDAHNLRGLVERQLGSERSACEAFKEAFSLDPSFAHAHYNHGRSALALGQLEQAQHDATRLMALDPELGRRLRSSLARSSETSELVPQAGPQ